MNKEQKIQWILERYANTDEYGRDYFEYMLFCLERMSAKEESGER